MVEVRYQRRWCHWILVVTFWLTYLPIVILPIVYTAKGVLVRPYLFVLAVTGYWALVVTLDRRQVVVTGEGVRISHAPLPVAAGWWVDRKNIVGCGIQDQADETEGYRSADAFSAGILDHKGHWFDVAGPFSKQSDAALHVQQILAVLNSNSANPSLAVSTQDRKFSFPMWKRFLSVWLSVYLITGLAGWLS